MSKISVFGSINMDLVLNLEDFPRAGQTVKAEGFEQLPGGKGANQSVAASKLGGDVAMYGLLGDDQYAKTLRKSLKDAGVRTSNIETKRTSSGLAAVLVDEKGENEIVIVPGANKLVGEEYASKVYSSIADSEYLLLQLETPLVGINKLLELLSDVGKCPEVILDPAPAIPLDKLPLRKIDILTPNESELNTLAGNLAENLAIEKILDKDTAIVLKKGEGGAEYFSRGTRIQVSPFEVSTEDTTGAGDAFNGALAVALAEGKEILKSIRFANAAGACATMNRGAAPSLPDRTMVDKLLSS